MMEQRDFSGRTAAEAAIKACEHFGIARPQLTYTVTSDEGEGLDRRVVISAEGDPEVGGIDDDFVAPVHDDSQHTDDDVNGNVRNNSGSQGRGNQEARGRSEGRSRNNRNGNRDRSNSSDGNSRNGRNSRNSRDGRRGNRSPRINSAQGGGIDELLKLSTLPDTPIAPRPDFTGECCVKATKAKEVLTALLAKMDLSLTVHLIEDGKEEIHIDMRGDDEARCIGTGGETLLAFQFLLNRMVGEEENDNRAVVVLDAAGYRGRRKDALSGLATKLAERAIEEQKVVRLSPMSAHDRRVFHITLREMEGVETSSEGDGLYRNLLIIPEAFVS